MKKTFMKALLEQHKENNNIQMGRSMDYFLKIYLKTNTNYKQKRIELDNNFKSTMKKVRNTLWNEYNFYIITIQDFHIIVWNNAIIDSLHAKENKIFTDEVLMETYGTKQINNMIYYFVTTDHPKKEISNTENVKTKEDNNVEPVVIF